jgi:hypothetical protein
MPLASLTVMFQRVLLGAALAVSMTVAAASPLLRLSRKRRSAGR